MPTALITGSAKRIGKSLAIHLAQRGWNVAIHYYRSEDEAKTLANEIRNAGRKSEIFPADLADEKNCAALVPTVNAAMGPISLLINNAAIFEKDSLETITGESFNQHIHTNFFAPLMLIRDFAAQTEEGSIINMLDGLTGWSMSPAFLSYTLSKTALHSLTALLAREIAPVRINGIALGAVLPGLQDKETTFDALQAVTPLHRLCDIKDVLHALDYLLSAENVTGQVITLSGGMHLAHPSQKLAQP